MADQTGGKAPRNVRAPKVVAFRPDVRSLEQTIRSLAKETANVWFLRHAEERMEQRGIDDDDVYRALRRGFVAEDSIRPGKNADEQACKVVEQNKGARDLGVAIIVVGKRKLLVKTVEWEDLK